MALPYYISEMVKSMRQDCIALEAELEMQGYPNLFKSTLVVTSKEWDLLHDTACTHFALYSSEYRCRRPVEEWICAGMWSP